MPGDSLRKVQPGEPFRPAASAWNAFVDAAEAHRAHRSDVSRRASRESSDTGIVLVRNDSGEARDRFNILGLDEPLVTPEDNETEFDNRVAFSGVEPEEQHAGRFCILLEPLADGKIGRGLVDGVCPVTLDVEDEGDEFAEVTSGEMTALKTGGSGSARILWKEEGTGSDKRGVVRLGSNVPLIQKVELKDDFLEEDGSAAECYRLQWNADDETWERKDPEEIVSIEPGEGFTGCAFQGDTLDVVSLKGRWYALTGGHHFTVAVADGDMEIGTNHGAGAGTATVREGLSITIHTAFTQIDSGEHILCWWDAATTEKHWDAIQLSEEEYGCGLERDAETGEVKVQPADLVAPDGGLAVDDDSSCGLKVQLVPGCGTVVSGPSVSVDLSQIVEVGNGLEVSEETCPKLSMSVGCGLIDDGAGNLQVDLPTIAGPGLETVGGGACDVLGVKVGCGLHVTTEGVEVTVSQLAGTGLVVEEGPGGCDRLSVDAAPVDCGSVSDCIDDYGNGVCQSIADCVTNQLTDEESDLCGVISGCIEDQIADGGTIADTIRDLIFNSLSDPRVCLAVWDCIEDPPERTCEECGPNPVYQWNGAAWDLVADCNCLAPVAPATPGLVVDQMRCGTCETDCGDCPEGTPLYVWNEGEWTLEDACGCEFPFPPEEDGNYEEQKACGACGSGAMPLKQKPANALPQTAAMPRRSALLPCVHRGDEVRRVPCGTCPSKKGVSLKVFRCALHSECVLGNATGGVRSCRGCQDRTPIPDGETAPTPARRVAKPQRHAFTWACGITTAPRQTPTLEQSLQSIRAAGWRPTIFAEPDSLLPAEAGEVVQRPRTFGAWDNFVAADEELLLHNTSHVLLFEDDALVCADARALLETDWPIDIGCRTLYTPAPAHRTTDGPHPISTANFVGALAVAFPADVLRRLLGTTAWRRGTDRTKDVTIGRGLAELGLSAQGWSPSPVRHIGESSTIWNATHRANGSRAEKAWRGDRKAAMSSLPGSIRQTTPDCLLVLQPRRIPEAVASIEALPIDQFWLTALTEPQLAPLLNGFIQSTDYRHYLIVSDDVVVTPKALACVRDLLTRHSAATGYCRLAQDDPRVNLTRSPLEPDGTRVGWSSYDFYTLDDIQRMDGEFPSWFGGWALTGLRRELWLDYPFEVNAGSRCQSDVQTALRMARDGRFFVSHRDAFVEHLKRNCNTSLDDGWLVGVERPATRFVAAEGAR